MSMQSLQDFFTAASQRPAIAEGLVQAVGEKQGEPAIAAVAAYAQGQGYDVTVEDARTVHQGFMRALEQNGELSDEDLAEVSGGVAVETLTVAATIGTIALIVVGGGLMTSGVVYTAVKDGVSEPVRDFFTKW